MDINRRFYERHGRDFSETRRRVQPGVGRILETLHGDESILDLGCGNGGFARALSRRGQVGSYLGLDFSVPMLEEAKRFEYAFPVHFLQADLVQLTSTAIQPSAATAMSMANGGHRDVTTDPPSMTAGWTIITAFAVLHHIPGREQRLELLGRVRGWLRAEGRFIHSNWQFTHNPRRMARVQPWPSVDLTADEVDTNDFLLDWRRGGEGIRYVHQFDEPELEQLAAVSGFRVVESFCSDGADRRSSLYQVWAKT